MNIPVDLKYVASDEWLRLVGKEAAIGITDYAQDQLSDIVFIEILVAEGDTVTKGQTIASIESVKAAADVVAPAGGKVVAINEKLAQTPEELNNDPFGKAWIIKMEVTNTSEVNSLMDSVAYEKHCQERSH
jgi:glycine cleavage system H protein